MPVSSLRRAYQARQKGMVSAERLNELMVQAQKDAFLGCLKEYHPHFWASKLHFYITRTPFYNFPTPSVICSVQGFMLAKEEGRGFAEKHRALLADTALMTVEDLARST